MCQCQGDKCKLWVGFYLRVGLYSSQYGNPNSNFNPQFTCMFGWLPAVVNHLLVCNKGCRYNPEDFSHQTLFLMHAVGYILVILKSLTNPLIFAIRQKNIREALKRFFHVIRYCKDRPVLVSQLHSPPISVGVNAPTQKNKRLQELTHDSTKSSFLSVRTSLMSGI